MGEEDDDIQAQAEKKEGNTLRKRPY